MRNAACHICTRPANGLDCFPGLKPHLWNSLVTGVRRVEVVIGLALKELKLQVIPVLPVVSIHLTMLVDDGLLFEGELFEKMVMNWMCLLALDLLLPVPWLLMRSEDENDCWNAPPLVALDAAWRRWMLLMDLNAVVLRRRQDSALLVTERLSLDVIGPRRLPLVWQFLELTMCQA